MKAFESLTEQEVLALAISLEEEDARIYGEFAHGLRESYPASAAMFVSLARTLVQEARMSLGALPQPATLPSAVVQLRTHVYPKRVLLEIVPGRGGAELEAWSLKKEADYFREVFRRELFVEVA